MVTNRSLWSGLMAGGLLTACGANATDSPTGTGGGAAFVAAGGQAAGSGGAAASSGVVPPGGAASPGSGGTTGPGGPLGGAGKSAAGTSAGGTPIPGGNGGSPGSAGSNNGGTAGGGGVPPSGGTSAGGASGGAAGASGGGGGGGGGGTGDIPHGACLDGITNYGTDGPFKYTTKTVGSVNFWVPTVPANCKVPIVHLANGTTATCSAYAPSLTRLASHGFLACCFENPNTGNGDQGVTALDTALMTFPDLADMKFGSTGHSQGGMAAFTVLARAEMKYGTKLIFAGLAMEPASGFGTSPIEGWQKLYAGIKAPMFMFSGLGTDGLVAQTWVQQAYDATAKTEEAYFWTSQGATHIPVPNTQEQQISIPWFRWKLLGDKQACTYFKGIPKMITTWAEVASKNAQSCQ